MDRKDLHPRLQEMMAEDDGYLATALRRQSDNIRLIKLVDPVIKVCEDISASTGLRLSVSQYSYGVHINLGMSIRIAFTRNILGQELVSGWVIGHPRINPGCEGPPNYGIQYFEAASPEGREFIKACLAAGREGWEQPRRGRDDVA